MPLRLFRLLRAAISPIRRHAAAAARLPLAAIVVLPRMPRMLPLPHAGASHERCYAIIHARDATCAPGITAPRMLFTPRRRRAIRCYALGAITPCH